MKIIIKEKASVLNRTLTLSYVASGIDADGDIVKEFTFDSKTLWGDDATTNCPDELLTDTGHPINGVHVTETHPYNTIEEFYAPGWREEWEDRIAKKFGFTSALQKLRDSE